MPSAREIPWRGPRTRSPTTPSLPRSRAGPVSRCRSFFLFLFVGSIGGARRPDHDDRALAHPRPDEARWDGRGSINLNRAHLVRRHIVVDVPPLHFLEWRAIHVEGHAPHVGIARVLDHLPAA